jgi:hypothetical protein
MHMRSKVAPLSDRCTAPRGLCNLVHRMLDKSAATRPSTAEVHEAARMIERELAIPQPACVERDFLERAVMARLPMLSMPRWTPQILNACADTRPARPHLIVPRGRNDQVKGEIKGR